MRSLHGKSPPIITFIIGSSGRSMETSGLPPKYERAVRRLAWLRAPKAAGLQPTHMHPREIGKDVALKSTLVQ